MTWNEEKSLVAACSAIAAGLAAQASRHSRLRSAEKLERELFSVSSSVRKIGSHIIDTENVILEEEEGDMMSHTLAERRSWAGLKTSSGLVVAHALVACTFVYALTQTKAGLDIGLWIGVFGDDWRHAVGLFSLLLLLAHVGVWMCMRDCSAAAGGLEGYGSASKEEGSKYRSDVRDEELEYFKSILGFRWRKDHDCSESMDPLSDLMSIHGIMRMAINTIKGAELDVVRDESSGVPVFKFDVLSGFLWFKVKEKYPMDWTEVRHRRRDFRPGGTFGKAAWKNLRLDKCDGKKSRQKQEVAVDKRPIVYIRNEFGGKWNGVMEEEFSWPNDRVMHVDTTVSTPNGRVEFRQVFHRV